MLERGWEGTAAMNPAINVSDLQNVTLNPQWNCEPCGEASNPAKEQNCLVENFFIAFYSLANQKSLKISMQFDPAHI